MLALAVCTHTCFVAFPAGCKQGQICCPQSSPPNKTKCSSGIGGDWGGGIPPACTWTPWCSHTATVAEWLQRPPWTPLWYPTDVSRETRSSYAHLPMGHWFPSCTLCSPYCSALACKIVLSLWQPFEMQPCQVRRKRSLCGFERRITNQIIVACLL